jgi:hypothetical protein
MANAIFYAAEHLVREIYVGGAGKSLEWLYHLAPDLADWLVSRIGYRPQLTDQPKTDQAPHNLSSTWMAMTGSMDPSAERQDRSVCIPAWKCAPGCAGGCWPCLLAWDSSC